jgi:hypothetical protein
VVEGAGPKYCLYIYFYMIVVDSGRGGWAEILFIYLLLYDSGRGGWAEGAEFAIYLLLYKMVPVGMVLYILKELKATAQSEDGFVSYMNRTYIKQLV